ncbi:MAG TPA: ATP-binding cassette domain-containing protein [Rhizomicrobium sp.]|nr:ATP-binding cassette domain-containing protein [Rhizomicrobium sp.]
MESRTLASGIMPSAALELSHVSKRFGDFTAVRDLSLTHGEGRILGFLGPNGAGKTTTLRMMLGLMKPDGGTLRILGKSPGTVRDRVGYLPEERGLYKRMRADSVIAYFAQLKGLDRATAHKRAHAMLERFGLAQFARVRIEGLSKGMAQKVAFIATLAHDPDVLILDEPFSGLDPLNRQSFEDAIRALARDGKTILFSTHTMEQAERLCDHLVILARGEKVFDGTLAEAHRLLPRRARIGAKADLGFLGNLQGVTSVSPPASGQPYWDIALKEGADGSSLLAACFEQRVELSHFDLSEPSLQDVFVSLAGREAEAAQ